MSFWRRLFWSILGKVLAPPGAFLNASDLKPLENGDQGKREARPLSLVSDHPLGELPRIVNPRLGLECRLTPTRSGYLSTLIDQISGEAIDRSAYYFSDLHAAILASMRRVGIREAEVDPPDANAHEKLGLRLRSIRQEDEHNSSFDPLFDSERNDLRPPSSREN